MQELSNNLFYHTLNYYTFELHLIKQIIYNYFIEATLQLQFFSLTFNNIKIIHI